MGDRQTRVEALEDSLGQGNNIVELMNTARGKREDQREQLKEKLLGWMMIKSGTFRPEHFDNGKLSENVLNDLKEGMVKQLSKNNVDWAGVKGLFGLSDDVDVDDLKEWFALVAVNALESEVNAAVDGKKFNVVKVSSKDFFGFNVEVEGEEKGSEESGSEEGGQGDNGREKEVSDHFAKLNKELDEGSEAAILAMVGKMGAVGFLISKMLGAKDEDGETMIGRLFKKPDSSPILAAVLGAMGVDRFNPQWEKAKGDANGNPQMAKVAGQFENQLAVLGAKVPEYLKVRGFSESVLKRVIEGGYFNKMNDQRFAVMAAKGEGTVSFSGKRFKVVWPDGLEPVFPTSEVAFTGELNEGVKVANVASIPSGTVFPVRTMIELVDEN